MEFWRERICHKFTNIRFVYVCTCTNIPEIMYVIVEMKIHSQFPRIVALPDLHKRIYVCMTSIHTYHIQRVNGALFMATKPA